MAKVLSISSQVVYGHVGNSSAAFVMQRMGHEVLSLPTVLLSNRPGYGAIAGECIDAGKLDAFLAAISENGWLDGLDAVLTGYVPTPGHAALCANWIARIKTRNADAFYLCDPIIGDEPAGIYISEEAASAMHARLVPLADVITPNCFELAWLSGRAIPDAPAAARAARSLPVALALITSAPAGALDKLANMLVDSASAVATVCRRETVHARGTGDFFAAIFLAHRLNGLDNRTALQASTAAMSLVLAASQGCAELKLIETQALWAASDPPLAPLAALPGLPAGS